MTYKEVLDFLYSQLPMYQRQGATAFKKDLSNTIALCRALGDPQTQFKSIHLAGTNGKGSTAHMIAAILQEAGMKVGLYTSPHYRDYRERIKINGKYISRKAVIDFVENNKSTIEEVKPSFFEMTVGLAFDYFAKQKVDIAVIETGLGGRLDSTNIIHPLISVITNIGYDHQNLLGDTLPEIAGEKAGIIKEGVPVVIGKKQEEIKSVFESKASQLNAQLIYAEDQIEVNTISASIDKLGLEVKTSGAPKYKVNLPSGVAFNLENCRTAIASIVALNTTGKISNDQIRNGLEDFANISKYLGRWQIKSKDPLVLLDAAHNEDGIKGLFKSLGDYNFQKMHIILGMVSDKDTSKILKLLPKNARYYFCRPDIPRGKSEEELMSEATSLGLNGRTYSSVYNALRAAKRAYVKGNLILATGSSFVVAELV